MSLQIGIELIPVPLSNSRQVSVLLERARGRRAVAATLMNERSSRSHSVFALKVKGFNSETGESCEGTLNLVDLAGSERLATSGAGENKDRLKETININKSLSALADVIGALGSGQQGGHVPYRNSTLTRLLQTSLSGESFLLFLTDARFFQNPYALQLVSACRSPWRDGLYSPFRHQGQLDAGGHGST